MSPTIIMLKASSTMLNDKRLLIWSSLRRNCSISGKFMSIFSLPRASVLDSLRT
ncbi:hypothetical protein D3C81_810810 [compost metagenome]